MNFLNLQYFVVVAEELSFTNAAKQLYVSQQCLSSHISKLEAYYGTKLFNRGVPMTLTEAGQALLRHAKIMLIQKRETEQELGDIAHFLSANLTIGIPVTRGTAMLPLILPPYHKKFPQVNLHLVEGTTTQITEALLQGAVDLIIGYHPIELSQVHCINLYRETFSIVIPNHLLIGAFPGGGSFPAGPLPISYFKDFPFILQSPHTFAGKIFQDCCNEANITPRVILETENLLTCISLAVAGMGICICPDTFLHSATLLKSEQLSKVTLIPLDYPAGQYDISISYLKNKYRTRALKEFITMTRQIFSPY
ncbi:LysR family transcriptional regulator [Faecalispora anaeroviscerum]|uniref:LysR family transcriptional regulator n=1 Tax=Faecalispora anaeroviscerum TaxID=2991836 RepID=UPI0024B96AE3|nr:LysR family transcriptional regulator [Faecalispora anaeroviscerum]